MERIITAEEALEMCPPSIKEAIKNINSLIKNIALLGETSFNWYCEDMEVKMKMIRLLKHAGYDANFTEHEHNPVNVSW